MDVPPPPPRARMRGSNLLACCAVCGFLSRPPRAIHILQTSVYGRVCGAVRVPGGMGYCTPPRIGARVKVHTAREKGEGQRPPPRNVGVCARGAEGGRGLMDIGRMIGNHKISKEKPIFGGFFYVVYSLKMRSFFNSHFIITWITK